MATNNYTFTGVARWVKVWPSQVDRKFQTPDRGGNWSLILTLDDQSAKLWNSLNLRGLATEEDVQIDQLKKKKKGKVSDLKVNDVTLRRYERHATLGNLGSPAVLGCETGTLIGNGSVLEASVDVYDYTYEGESGFAARLVAVTVLDLIEFVRTPVVNEEGPPVH